MSQEINFGLSLERALEGIEAQLRIGEVEQLAVMTGPTKGLVGGMDTEEGGL